MEHGVRALLGHDIVEGEHLLRQIEQDRQQIFPLSCHDPEAQLVVQRDGGRLGFREQLGVGRIQVLASTDELGDREAFAQHGADDPVHFLLDQVKEVPIAHRQAEQQLAPVRVIDDLHRLEHRARCLLAVPGAGRHHHQLLRARVLYRLREGERKIAPQVGDRLLLESGDVDGVMRVIGVEFVIADELRRLLLVRHVETVPVDDGVTAQDQAHGVDVLQTELGQIPKPAEPVGRALGGTAGGGRRRIAIHPRLGEGVFEALHARMRARGIACPMATERNGSKEDTEGDAENQKRRAERAHGCEAERESNRSEVPIAANHVFSGGRPAERPRGGGGVRRVKRRLWLVGARFVPAMFSS
jgi:hypothetical protein